MMEAVSLAVGVAVFVILVFLLEPAKELRRYWIARVFTALAVSLAVWKLTPIWTRFDAVVAQPSILWEANSGLASVFGGLFAFLSMVALGLWQIRKERPGTRRWPLAVPVAAGLALVGAWLVAQPLIVPKPATKPPSAVQLLVPDLEGRPHAVSDWKGKVVVLHFWATGSAPCLAELPDLQAFTAQPSSRVVVVGVNQIATEKDGESGVIRFAVEHKMNWTQLTDPEGILRGAFSVTVLPTTVVLDPEGRVVDRREGAVDLLWLKTLEGRYAR